MQSFSEVNRLRTPTKTAHFQLSKDEAPVITVTGTPQT